MCERGGYERAAWVFCVGESCFVAVLSLWSYFVKQLGPQLEGVNEISLLACNTTMYVCNTCKDVKLQLLAGGSGPLMSPLPTKLLMSWEDIGTDHPDIPATFFVEWEEAQPKNLQAD